MFCVSDPETIYFSLCESVDATTHATSLRLLNDVEQTVDSLIAEQATIESLNNLVRSHTLDANCKVVEVIDPDDKITDKIEQTEILMIERLSMLKARRVAALFDPELNGVHEESVVMEFERTYTMLAELIESMSILRNHIKEHDAELDSYGESFDNATNLVAHLRK